MIKSCLRIVLAYALSGLALWAIWPSVLYAAETRHADRPEHSPITALGDERYRIDKIVLNKPKHSFTVPGKIIRLAAPLEFIAVARAGGKAYESLIELDADAIDFNLACILIGLKANPFSGPKFHFDPRILADGGAVSIEASWTVNDKSVRVPIASLIRAEGVKDIDSKWVYTGSYFNGEGQYLAQMDGTVIGFVHDPSSIIEHSIGVGLNDYGAVAGNPSVAPPVGTEVLLEVRRP